MRNALWFGVLAFAIGCGGEDNAKPSVSTNKTNVCDQIAAVACYDMYQCCSEGEIERDLGVTDPRTEDQCKTDLSKLCERRLADAEASLAAGRVQFDASVMNDCLKALLLPGNQCATVAEMAPWTAACMDTAWVGQVAPGLLIDQLDDPAGERVEIDGSIGQTAGESALGLLALGGALQSG